mmetsp:Transcript_24029/g.44203  ORF Transcript_24029/g.44203 Transcript_24029/m.44203 type:complete len:210 (-) Transcript_24029:1393-2022(-)
MPAGLGLYQGLLHGGLSGGARHGAALYRDRGLFPLWRNVHGRPMAGRCHAACGHLRAGGLQPALPRNGTRYAAPCARPCVSHGPFRRPLHHLRRLRHPGHGKPLHVPRVVFHDRRAVHAAGGLQALAQNGRSARSAAPDAARIHRWHRGLPQLWLYHDGHPPRQGGRSCGIARNVNSLRRHHRMVGAERNGRSPAGRSDGADRAWCGDR